MYETNTVAIVRRCFSERSAPELGFLRPHIAHDHIVSRARRCRATRLSMPCLAVYVLHKITLC